MTETINRCPICGGNAGRIPSGGHYYCQELQKRGLPTPSLGNRCESCNGSGTQRRELPAQILLPIDPTAAEIRRWFPLCPDCNGKGYKPVEENLKSKRDR